MAQLTLRPNAVGTYQQWSLTNATHYGATSDQNDATYVYVIGNNVLKETENLADTPQAGTINFVMAYIRIKATGSGTPERVHILWRTHDTDYLSYYIGVGRDSFHDYSHQRDVNPYSGQAWTWDEVNALQIGAIANNLASGERFDISEIWIVVDYVVETLQTVTDSFGMTDVPLVNKPLLQIVESFGMTDVPLTDKTLIVEDAFGLTDIPLIDKILIVADSFGMLDEVFISKLKEVLDSFGMTDTVLVDKLISVLDSLGITDVPLVNKPLLSVTDYFGMTDVPLVNKPLLSVADSFGQTDVPLVHKSLLQTSDSFGMADVPLVNKPILVTDFFGMTDVPLIDKALIVEDSFGILDSVLVDKVLQMLDAFGMTEVVIVYYPPVAKVYKFHLPMVRIVMLPRGWVSVKFGHIRIGLRRPHRPFVPQRPAEGVKE